MTAVQYRRWRAFALAMGQHGFRESTPARAARRATYLENFFAGVSETEWRAWSSWDQPPAAPVMHVCDHFSEFLQFLPGYWSFVDRDRDRWRWRFEGELHCCLRAGIDLVGEPSAGVWGFTVGDLRRMFPGRLPLWVRQAFTEDPRRASADEPVWL